MGEVPTGPWVLLIMAVILAICGVTAGISAIGRLFLRLKREVKNLEAQGNGKSNSHLFSEAADLPDNSSERG